MSLYFFVSVSCMFRSAISSLISVYVLWICGLFVFRFVDLLFSVDLFFQNCGICCKFGLWFLSFGQSQIWLLSIRAWSDLTRDFSQLTAGLLSNHSTRSGRFRVKPKPKPAWPMDTPKLNGCLLKRKEKITTFVRK